MAPPLSSSNVGFFAFWIFFLSVFSNVCSRLDEPQPTDYSKKLARGWGDHLQWNTLQEGLDLAEKVDKPVMLIIHKTWCGACRKLKDIFASNNEITRLSKDFVLVNLEDDEEPSDAKYSPDGGYIPRILFVDGKANVRDFHYNENGNAKYKYFYSSAREVILSMKKVIDTWHHDSDEPIIDGGDGQVYDEL